MEIKSLKGLEFMSSDSEALLFWESREAKIEKEERIVNEAKEQGRIEEKISMAKKLKAVLDIEIIAEKIGLTVAQVKNLEIDNMES